MGVPNITLESYLLERNHGLTKVGAAQAIHEIETSFVEEAKAAGVEPEELLKLAQESPDKWNAMINSYVNDLVVLAAEQQQKLAQKQQADAEHMSKVAEDTETGQRIAHAFWDEFNKIAAHMYTKQAEDAAPEEKKDEGEKDEKKKDEEKKDEEKKDGDKGVPPALQAYINKEKAPEDKEEAAKEAFLRVDAEATHSAIMKKASARRELTPEEREYLANYKLAQAGLISFSDLIGQG